MGGARKLAFVLVVLMIIILRSHVLTENQDCIFVSYEWYFCTQIVNGVGSCDANYATSYCEIRDQVSLQLCNGDSIEVENPDYPFGGLDLGYFKKNPAGVLVKFGPGQGLYTSGCYKIDYDPVSGTQIYWHVPCCSSFKTFVVSPSLTIVFFHL